MSNREFKQKPFWATHVNRKWTFCNIRQWYAFIFGRVISITARQLSYTIMAASRYYKKGKRLTSGWRALLKNDSFPVDVRYSKTTHFWLTCVTQKRLISGWRVTQKRLCFSSLLKQADSKRGITMASSRNFDCMRCLWSYFISRITRENLKWDSFLTCLTYQATEIRGSK